MKFFLFIVIVAAVIFGVITFQNPDLDISFTFSQWIIAGPIALIIAVPFGAGILMGITLLVPGWMKKAKQARVHKRKVGELEEELAKAQDQVEQLSLAEEEMPEETDIEEDERKGPGDVF